MSVRPRKSKQIERFKEEQSLRSLAVQWAGWIVKILLTIMDPSKNNSFIEGTPGTSFNDAKNPEKRQRVILMAKIDLSTETPCTISPKSGVLYYKTIVDPDKLEFRMDPGIGVPYFNLITEIHSGVDRGEDKDGFVGINMETWRFAVLGHIVGIWRDMCKNGKANELKIRDENGMLFEFTGESGLRRLYKIQSDDTIRQDQQKYENALANNEKDAKYKYPIQYRVPLTPEYLAHVNMTYDINAEDFKVTDGYITGLFYKDDTSYTQYSCDNGCGIQMYPEGPPNEELGEKKYGHIKAIDLSPEDRNKILRSRALFSNIDNWTVLPEFVSHFEKFSDYQQSIVRMCACTIGGYCCYVNSKKDQLESDEVHKNSCSLGPLCCRIRPCANKPDIYTKLLDEWATIANQSVENDKVINRVKKVFRPRTAEELTKAFSADAINTILDNDSDGLNDIDAVVALSEMVPIENANSTESAGYLTLNQIINKLSKSIARPALIDLLNRSLIGSKDRTEKQNIEAFRDLVLEVMTARTLQYEFQKFQFRNRDSKIDGKLIEPEFWLEWNIWVNSGVPSRNYILRVKQKHYQTIGLEKSQIMYDELMKSWNSPFKEKSSTQKKKNVRKNYKKKPSKKK